MTTISKPIKRNKIRRLLGKEFYILKRQWEWVSGTKKWAKKDHGDFNRNVVFEHKSTILRKLKNLLNETVDDFKLELWLDDEFLHGRLLSETPLENSFRVEERNHLIKQQFWGGYTRHNEIVQIETDPDGNETERLLVQNHAIMMYSPLLEDKS